MRKTSSNSNKKVMEEVLSNLFQKGETIKLAPDPPFSSSELKAYEWDINTTINYISEKLDLSQYATLLTQLKVTGSTFISIDEQYPLPGLTFTHPLHQIKFFSHAKRLRESIIRKAKDSRPNQLETWSPIHVASWLHIEQGKVKEACVCIRQHMSGDMLYRIAEGTSSSSSSLIADLKNNLTNENMQDLMKNIQSLVQSHPRGKVSEIKKENNQEEVEENHQKKKTKSTAMGKRRKNKEKNQENNIESNKEKHSLIETNELTKPEIPLPPDYATIDHINSKPPVLSEKNNTNQDKITQININLPSTTSSASKTDKQTSTVQEKPTNKPSEPSKQVNQSLQAINNQATNQIHEINQKLEQELQQNRQHFLHKIQSLQQIVEQHAETIGSLRQEAHVLKTNQTNVESQISLANNKTKDLIQKLIQDRDLATKQLEQVVQLYTLTTNKEEKELTKVLQTLKDDQQRNSLIIPSIPSISTSNINSNNTIQQQIRSLEKLNQAESIVSKPSNVSERDVSGVDHEGDSDLDDLAPSPRPSNPSNTSKSNAQTTLQSNLQSTIQPNTQIIPSQTVSQANLPKETLSSLVVLPTQTPLKHASMTLKQSDIKDTQQTQSITTLMQETIESDILLWKQLLSEYSVKPPVDDKANTSLDPFHITKQPPVTMIYKVSDSRQMFLQIAIKWIRLGQRMQQDITNKTKESGIFSLHFFIFFSYILVFSYIFF